MNGNSSHRPPNGQGRNFRMDPDEILFMSQQRPRPQTRPQPSPKPSQPKQKKTLKPRKKKKGVSILKLMMMTVLFVVLLATGALSAGVAWYVVKLSEDLPSMLELANPKNSLPSIMYDRNGEVIARLFIENRTPLDLVVSDYIFGDGIIYDDLTENYVRKLAELMRKFAAEADEVIECFAGLIYNYKTVQKNE